MTFIRRDFEPTEPNITALSDAEHIKWKELLTPEIRVPTPWRKTLYDSLDMGWQMKRSMMNNRITLLQKK